MSPAQWLLANEALQGLDAESKFTARQRTLAPTAWDLSLSRFSGNRYSGP
jgi:hypothetical protein